MWFRSKPEGDPTAAVRALRDEAIRVSADDIDLAPATALGRVWGVLVEIGYPEPVATLVALSDGTTSLYFSNGGGVIGAGEHAAVRDAASHLLTSLTRISPIRTYVRYPIADCGAGALLPTH